MIKNLNSGWCNFKLGSFIGHPSYLTDVPVDLLNAFIELHKNESGIVWFDEEGSEFTLVLVRNSIFIIEEKEKPILHDFSELNIFEIEKELILDIENDFDKWVKWLPDDDEKKIKERKKELKKLIKQLKILIKYRIIDRRLERKNEYSKL